METLLEVDLFGCDERLTERRDTTQRYEVIK